MFTGIVDHVGEIIGVQPRSNGMSFTIKTRFENCELGESICVDGICLTVTGSQAREFNVDLSPETLSCTQAGNWQVGQRVHLERALRMGDRLGGHWVTGHVDTRVHVADLQHDGDCLFVQIGGVDPTHLRYLVDKGSITLDGVSLTINALAADGFSVMLIPQTLALTHFDQLKKNQQLHIEYDYLLKWAARDNDLKNEGIGQ